METARALPPSAFLDAAVYDAEMAVIFRREWMAVARVDALANPGDFLAVDVADAKLLITRDEAGVLHALSRVCRHRAMLLDGGCGQAKAFTCPYHRWRYGLDGRLLSAPAMNGSELFDVSETALERFSIDVWEGWIFVNLDPQAAPLATRMAPISALVAGDGLAGMKLVNTQVFPSPWNWKVLVENFSESYHHIGPHAESLQKTNPAFETYARTEADEGTYLAIENPPSEGADPFSVYVGFPLFLFAVQRGDVPTVVWYQMTLRSHTAFDLSIHILMPEPFASDPAIIDLTRDAMRRIHLEDIDICDRVQEGLGAAPSSPGPLSPLERGLWQFHRYLRRMMQTEV
jgi:phenylpropionate dioxygenase-like ring-hydroxylating dioxygenase large terminal subunit